MQQYGTLIYLVFLVGVFYFMILRPQKQRQASHEDLIKNLQTEDYVYTVGGVVGKVVKINEDTVILKVDDNVKLEVIKAYVAGKR